MLLRKKCRLSVLSEWRTLTFDTTENDEAGEIPFTEHFDPHKHLSLSTYVYFFLTTMQGSFGQQLNECLTV